MKSSDAHSQYQEYLQIECAEQHHLLTREPAQYWQNLGQHRALEVFHHTLSEVPAYRDFILRSGISPASIQTIEDFINYVPQINKQNYLSQYPLHDLLPNGSLDEMNVISVSSGSSGDPYFWPRDIWQEREVDHWYELLFRYLFKCRNKRSLLIIAYAIGMYIAGPFTFASALRISQKGYPLTITTPGNDIEAVLKVVQRLGKEYEQIIIGGYPPLLRDIIGAGLERGIRWHDYQTKLFFGGEGFSELWRDYIQEALDINANLSDTINMYGSADAALLGMETPLSILYRRTVTNNPDLQKKLLLADRLPSILSYNPLLKYFESLSDGTLLLTSSSGLPLIRYAIGDQGGVVDYDTVVHQLSDVGLEVADELAKEGLPQWRLPLVYLYGRKDFTVQLYGANIYPENIKEALEQPEIRDKLTGKFTMSVDPTIDHRQQLHIVIELAPSVRPMNVLAMQIKNVIWRVLKECNSEYADSSRSVGERAMPNIILKTYGHIDFKSAIKHRWIKAN